MSQLSPRSTCVDSASIEKAIHSITKADYSTLKRTAKTEQGCHTVYFQTKKSHFGLKFGGPWNGICCYIIMAMWNTLHPFGIIYGRFV
jgi:hypothetical protein